MRTALVVVVAVGVAVAAFAIAKSSGGGSETSSGVIHIRVKGGKPIGGVRKITASKGHRVHFTVTSDVGDEVHVHGYNFHKDVKPGGMVSFNFPATIDGTFVVELESRSEQIASLEVQP